MEAANRSRQQQLCAARRFAEQAERQAAVDRSRCSRLLSSGSQVRVLPGACSGGRFRSGMSATAAADGHVLNDAVEALWKRWASRRPGASYSGTSTASLRVPRPHSRLGGLLDARSGESYRGEPLNRSNRHAFKPEEPSDEPGRQPGASACGFSAQGGRTPSRRPPGFLHPGISPPKREPIRLRGRSAPSRDTCGSSAGRQRTKPSPRLLSNSETPLESESRPSPRLRPWACTRDCCAPTRPRRQGEISRMTPSREAVVPTLDQKVVHA